MQGTDAAGLSTPTRWPSWRPHAASSSVPRQAIRLTEHTGGHPLWVHTLLVELSPAELRSPGELPAPRSLASAVTACLSEVSTSGRALAEALSVINQRVALAVVGRVAGIAQPLEGFESLLAAGLVRWDSREAAIASGLYSPPLPLGRLRRSASDPSTRPTPVRRPRF